MLDECTTKFFVSHWRSLELDSRCKYLCISTLHFSCISFILISNSYNCAKWGKLCMQLLFWSVAENILMIGRVNNDKKCKQINALERIYLKTQTWTPRPNGELSWRTHPKIHSPFHPPKTPELKTFCCTPTKITQEMKHIRYNSHPHPISDAKLVSILRHIRKWNI